MSFTFHEINTAQDKVKSELKLSEKAFGFLPGLHKVLAESPTVLRSYKFLHNDFQNTSFDATELTVVWQTINWYHKCHYCLPAHTGIAHMMKVKPSIIDALSNGESLSDEKLRVLQETTFAMVDQRGDLSEEQIFRFKRAGYGNEQLLEIVLGLAQKTISNYANKMANTPVDEPFIKFVKLA